jgi:hypothetical protein
MLEIYHFIIAKYSLNGEKFRLINHRYVRTNGASSLLAITVSAMYNSPVELRLFERTLRRLAADEQ